MSSIIKLALSGAHRPRGQHHVIGPPRHVTHALPWALLLALVSLNQCGLAVGLESRRNHEDTASTPRDAIHSLNRDRTDFDRGHSGLETVMDGQRGSRRKAIATYTDNRDTEVRDIPTVEYRARSRNHTHNRHSPSATERQPVIRAEQPRTPVIHSPKSPLFTGGSDHPAGVAISPQGVSAPSAPPSPRDGVVSAVDNAVVDTLPAPNYHRQASQGGPMRCEDAQKRCISQLGCSMALSIYLLNCSPLISGETHDCGAPCRRALVSLLSIEVGKAFMTCDCGSNDVCASQRGRLDVCSQPVLQSMRALAEAGASVSCDQASMLCRAESACLTALQFYKDRCRRLFLGERCTSRCNNSLSILYRQPAAQHLRTCYCDGTEGYNCPELRWNTQRLCIEGQRPWRVNQTHSEASGEGGGEAGSGMGATPFPLGGGAEYEGEDTNYEYVREGRVTDSGAVTYTKGVNRTFLYVTVYFMLLIHSAVS